MKCLASKKLWTGCCLSEEEKHKNLKWNWSILGLHFHYNKIKKLKFPELATGQSEFLSNQGLMLHNLYVVKVWPFNTICLIPNFHARLIFYLSWTGPFTDTLRLIIGSIIDWLTDQHYSSMTQADSQNLQ